MKNAPSGTVILRGNLIATWGSPVSPSFEDGVANQRVIDAIERAASARAWVNVPQQGI